MSGAALHIVFDIFAWASAALAGWIAARIAPSPFPLGAALRRDWLVVVIAGAAAGAYVFGTANLWASGQAGVARSIEGAIFGGVLAVELWKRLNRVTARTGAALAAPLAAGVAVGRIGCFLAGLDDFTYGTPTALPFAHDFGDGVPRHPVQLYESAAMATFLAVYLIAAPRRAFVRRNGFYLAVGFYGAQRFVWELLKPYAGIVGPLTVFHLLSAALLAYALIMLVNGKRKEPQ
ncbi:MAG: prolipoprotein diacylglyceryl transferase [Methylobacteriaceae bacterium]|nr:prolipoprotein diacylglyceryl transferase [Methylobacteriaceae bacterium]